MHVTIPAVVLLTNDFILRTIIPYTLHHMNITINSAPFVICISLYVVFVQNRFCLLEFLCVNICILYGSSTIFNVPIYYMRLFVICIHLPYETLITFNHFVIFLPYMRSTLCCHGFKLWFHFLIYIWCTIFLIYGLYILVFI